MKRATLARSHAFFLIMTLACWLSADARTFGRKPPIACFQDWSGFGRLLERNMLDSLVDADGPEQTVDLAIAYFKERKPDRTYIQSGR